jgi:hypothetical protein
MTLRVTVQPCREVLHRKISDEVGSGSDSEHVLCQSQSLRLTCRDGGERDVSAPAATNRQSQTRWRSPSRSLSLIQSWNPSLSRCRSSRTSPSLQHENCVRRD